MTLCLTFIMKYVQAAQHPPLVSWNETTPLIALINIYSLMSGVFVHIYHLLRQLKCANLELKSYYLCFHVTFCPPPVQLAAVAPVRALVRRNSLFHTPAAYESFTGLTSIGFGDSAGERTDYYLEVEI